MNKNLLVLAAALASFGLAAQPVLQQANLATPGLSATINVGPYVSPGPAGANQTWNFASITTSAVGTYSIVNCSSTACSSGFPAANWCYLAGPEYTYMQSSASQLEILGSSIPTNCVGGEIFSNTKAVLIFPFNYQASTSDGWVSNQDADTYSATYDGYGTLITPFGTYNNVVRLSVADGTSLSTIWLTSNPIYQLMTIDQGGNTIIMSNTTFSIHELTSRARLSLQPNPCGATLHVKLLDQTETKTTIEVVDMLGQKVMSDWTDSGEKTLHTEALPAGVYFVRTHNSDGQGIMKFIKE